MCNQLEAEESHKERVSMIEPQTQYMEEGHG